MLNLLANASSGIWVEIQNELTALINGMWLPIVAIMAALGVLFGCIIGWNFWTAGGDEAKIQKAKSNIKWYVIGWFALFIIAFTTPLLVGVLSTWAQGV